MRVFICCYRSRRALLLPDPMYCRCFREGKKPKSADSTRSNVLPLFSRTEEAEERCFYQIQCTAAVFEKGRSRRALLLPDPMYCRCFREGKKPKSAASTRSNVLPLFSRREEAEERCFYQIQCTAAVFEKGRSRRALLLPDPMYCRCFREGKKPKSAASTRSNVLPLFSRREEADERCFYQIQCTAAVFEKGRSRRALLLPDPMYCRCFREGKKPKSAASTGSNVLPLFSRREEAEERCFYQIQCTAAVFEKGRSRRALLLPDLMYCRCFREGKKPKSAASTRSNVLPLFSRTEEAEERCFYQIQCTAAVFEKGRS